MSIASFTERLFDFRSWWIVFIHVVRGCPGGLLQFSKGAAVKIFLASVLSGIRACGRTVRNAVLGQQLKGAVAQLSVSPHRSALGGTVWFSIVGLLLTVQQNIVNINRIIIHWLQSVVCLLIENSDSTSGPLVRPGLPSRASAARPLDKPL